MTNRSSAKRHGAHGINERRAKSTLRCKKNKLKARMRRAALLEKGIGVNLMSVAA